MVFAAERLAQIVAYLVVVVGHEHRGLLILRHNAFFILFFFIVVLGTGAWGVVAVVWRDVLVQILYLVVVHLVLRSRFLGCVCLGISGQGYAEGAALAQCAVHRHCAVV